MTNCKKFLSIMLSVILMVSLSFSVPIGADNGAVAQRGYVNGTGVRLREYANTSCTTVTTLSKVYVDVLEEVEGTEAESGYGKTWYKVTYSGSDGVDYTGYIYGKYLIFPSDQNITDDFERQLLSFPESYRSYLREIKRMYPNWSFIADNLSITFDQAVNEEYRADIDTPEEIATFSPRKLITTSYAGEVMEWLDTRCYINGAWKIYDGSDWTGASRTAIAYYMDPRNFLNPTEIYMFMNLTYDSSVENSDGLRKVVQGTFLANGYDTNGDGISETDAYISDIMYAAQQTGVSPYFIASKIIIEQGSSGNSPLISGTYPGFENLYNFFNYGASGAGTAQIINGLGFASNKGWTTRRASIVGGAELTKNGYLEAGQNTYYYMNYNVKNMVWNHQYATNIRDAYLKGIILGEAYSTNQESSLVFKIPVYKNMPETVSRRPGSENTDGSNNNNNNNNNNGNTVNTKLGDANGDGVIDAVDLAAIKLHILGLRTLSGSVMTAADANGDGVIDAVDLAAVKLHILGLRVLG